MLRYVMSTFVNSTAASMYAAVVWLKVLARKVHTIATPATQPVDISRYIHGGEIDINVTFCPPPILYVHNHSLGSLRWGDN